MYVNWQSGTHLVMQQEECRSNELFRKEMF